MNDGAPPSGMEDFVNQETVTPSASPAPTPVAPPPGMQNFVSNELFGTLGQQALSAVEGVARGATLGASDLAETKLLGIPAENIKARMQANPGTSIGTSVLGSAGLIALTGGVAAAPAEALLGPGLASASLAAGIEGAGLGAGSAISDYALGDPNLNAQKILADVGMGAAIGIGSGALGYGIKSVIGKFGGIKGSLSETISQEAADANNSAETAQAVEGLDTPGLKSNTPEIMDAADRQNLPIMNGMVSDDPWVQKAEDSLINGAPTYSGIRRANMYADGYNKAIGVLDSVVPDQPISKQQLGSVLQDSLSSKIDQEAKPFNDLYSAIKEDTQTIPLSERSAPSISRNIRDFVSDPSIGKNSPAAKLAVDIADEIGDLKTVDDLRGYQSGLSSRLSGVSTSPAEKRIIGIVSDKLDDWERRTIKNYANDLISKVDMTNPEEAEIWGNKVNRLQTLLSRIDEADAQYRPFKQKLSELSSWLGKGKVGGAKDAVDFIQNRLEPEDLINKLTQKKYASMYDFMEKNFPQESSIIRQYQKSTLRDAATKTGIFSPKTLFNKVNSLEPEIQNAIFHPEELQKIKDVETYLGAFPKNFNPSGTSGMNAFREFFKSPTGALVSNARDFGIEAFIKTMGAIPEASRPDAYATGAELAQKFNQYNAARNIIEKTNENISRGVQSILTGSVAPATNTNVANLSFDKKVDRIKELSSDPNALGAHLGNHIDGITQNLPNVSQGAATSISKSVQFLSSKIPRPPMINSLIKNWKPSDVQIQKFNQYYDAVDNPIKSLNEIKEGSLTSEMMESLSICHPDLLKDMQSQITQKLNSESYEKMSYDTKQSLSMFLGEPLDESMIQSVRMNNQMIFQNPQPLPSQQRMMGKTTQKGLEQLHVANREKTNTDRGEIKDSV